MIDGRLKSDLANWTIKNQISHQALNSLLHILKPHHPELSTDAQTLLSTPQQVITSVSQPHPDYSSILQQILRNQNSFLRVLNNLEERFKGWETEQQGGAEFSFPITAEESLATLEARLSRDPVVRNKLNYFFKRCGGVSAADFGRRCCRASISDEVLKLYCSQGRSPIGKKDFSQLFIYKFMRDGMYQANQAFEEKDLKKGLSGWLRHTKERLKSI